MLAHIDLNGDGNVGPFDGHEANGDNSALKYDKLYQMLSVKTRLQNRGHSLKTMVSIGGWNDSQHFSSIAGSALKRSVFMADMLSVIEYWNLDGIEIDWKYPVKGGAKPGVDADRNNFVTFLTEIRQTMDSYARGKVTRLAYLLSIILNNLEQFFYDS